MKGFGSVARYIKQRIVCTRSLLSQLDSALRKFDKKARQEEKEENKMPSTSDER